MYVVNEMSKNRKELIIYLKKIEIKYETSSITVTIK